MLERGSGDLVAEFTQPLPGMVFAHVLGLPEADYPRFKAWGEEVLADTYPTLNRTERGEGLHGAHPEFSAYIDGLVAERRLDPRDDLITRMTQPNAEGDVLSDTEIRVTVMHLIIAGHETTTNLLGNLLEHLLSTPDDLARMRTDPAMIAVAVEESLRRDPPVLIQPKTCVHAIEKHGRDRRGGHARGPQPRGRQPRRDGVPEPRRVRARPRRTPRRTTRSAAARTSAPARRSRASKAASRSRCSSTSSPMPRCPPTTTTRRCPSSGPTAPSTCPSRSGPSRLDSRRR